MAMKTIGVGDVQLGPLDLGYVNDVLRSGRLSYGPYSKRFEREWAALQDRRYAVFMNSGTSALQVAIHAMKIKYKWQDGDTVLVPALTFVASVNTIIANGLKPVLIDIEPGTYSIDMDQVEEYLGRMEAAEYGMPVAIMPVHLFGGLADMPRLMPIAKALGVKVIEDSCETVAAEIQGVRNFGSEASCYSTYACHHVTTGVGGFATTDDPELAALFRSLANHGRDGVFFDPAASGRELISKRFKFDHLGYSYRCTELEAAIGCAQLASLGDQIEVRRRNAALLGRLLQDLPLVLPSPRGRCTWMFYPLLSDERDDLCTYLESRGVETRPFLPLTNQPVYKGRFHEDHYPVAADVNRRGFYVGVSHALTPSDMECIAAIIRDFYRS